MFRRVASCRFFALCTVLSLSFLIRDAAAWTPPTPPPPSPPRPRRPSTGGAAAAAAAVSSRDEFLLGVAARPSGAAAALLLAAVGIPRPSRAAPPFAVMSEEVGYFPVSDPALGGATVMVPAPVRRESTEQATSLARYLRSSGAVMYGAFWCPHCRRQRELFGREAFGYVDYVECDPRGYMSKFATCAADGVEGYPSWKFGNGEARGGEMELVEIARASGYLRKKGRFDASLETGVPPLGGASCR
jgi:hypothetical protein